jgi:predicted DNA-binding transcriptional regulator YafY
MTSFVRIGGMLGPMRASRLVNLLLLLQSRGQQTAAQLADELEVSVRTVYRDVEALAEAGVPIYAERGPAGGVRLVDGYRTRLTGLTADEAEALFLSGLPGPAAELGLGTVVTAARLKVLAALPPELRTRAARIQSRFHLDAPGWFRQSEPLPSLELLASAVWETREVEVTYRREAKVERRRLGPLGLVLKGGTWYLVALSKGEPRTFRVSRIEDAVLGEPFERPAGFDLPAFWAASTARFEEAQAPIDVTVRIEPGGRDAFERVIGPNATATIRRVGRPAEDGSEVVRFRHESLEIAWTDLLRLGGRTEALDPAELRERLERTARGLAERYLRGEPTAGSTAPIAGSAPGGAAGGSALRG